MQRLRRLWGELEEPRLGQNSGYGVANRIPDSCLWRQSCILRESDAREVRREVRRCGQHRRRAISEDGPYMEKAAGESRRPILVARSEASMCGDLAKRARFIVSLLVPGNCWKTKREF